MKTLQPRNEQTTAATLDRSFNEWVPRHELANLVPHLVKTATATPAITGASANGAAVQAEMALAVLVYCYAIGIYRSSEIQRRLGRTQARAQMPARPLDAAALAQFRRLHAPLVKECLASALLQAFRVRWNTRVPCGNMPPRLQFSDRQQAADSNPVALLESEAERRLEIAEAWDRFDQEGLLGRAEELKLAAFGRAK